MGQPTPLNYFALRSTQKIKSEKTWRSLKWVQQAKKYTWNVCDLEKKTQTFFQKHQNEQLAFFPVVWICIFGWEPLNFTVNSSYFHVGGVIICVFLHSLYHSISTSEKTIWCIEGNKHLETMTTDPQHSIQTISLIYTQITAHIYIHRKIFAIGKTTADFLWKFGHW